jgi:hypothetical protein
MWRTFLLCLGSAFQVLLIITFFISQAQATLIDRGVGMIYDTESGVTWLQDANYANISEYIPDSSHSPNHGPAYTGGRMTQLEPLEEGLKIFPPITKPCL